MCAASEHPDPLRCGGSLSPRERLCHAALIYETTDDLLAITIPFLLDGVAAGERTLVVTGAGNAAAVADALGDTAGQVDFQAADLWLTSPWRALVTYRRYLERHTSDGGRMRIVGEPFATPRSTAHAADWTRYEALINDAFAAVPATLLCPYDARVLDPQVVAHARCTHPELVDLAGETHPSEEFCDVQALSASLDAVPLAPAPRDAVERSIAAPTPLSELRRFVAERADAAGLGAERADDVTFAAHEVAVNAREHGGGAGTLRTWTAGGEFVCEVLDRGAGMRDPLAGTVEPLPLQPDGRGLWLARQLCDLVEVRSSTTGTVVRLHMALG